MAPRDTRRGDRHKIGYNNEFNRENYVQLNFRVRKDSGIAEALMRVADAGISKNEYVRKAVVEQLRKDGYLQD